jgi:hypothetical protein
VKVELIGSSASSARSTLARAGLYLARAGSAALLSGCMGPTYGTGTPAEEQLLQDLSSAVTLTPGDKKKTIAYEPRPDIVMPASTAVLPPPQEDIAVASNPNWPEAPEQRLARVRAEATAHQDDPNYHSGITPDVESGPRKAPPIRTRGGDPLEGNTSPRNTRAAFNKRLAETQQGSPTVRRYLSEPPLTYRQPASTAPVGDVGEDEWKKKKERDDHMPERQKY